MIAFKTPPKQPFAFDFPEDTKLVVVPPESGASAPTVRSSSNKENAPPVFHTLLSATRYSPSSSATPITTFPPPQTSPQKLFSSPPLFTQVQSASLNTSAHKPFPSRSPPKRKLMPRTAHSSLAKTAPESQFPIYNDGQQADQHW